VGSEPAGLVKFDFLGLKTLTVLDVAVKLLSSEMFTSIWRRCRSTMPELPDAGARDVVACSRLKPGHAAGAGGHAPGPL